MKIRVILTFTGPEAENISSSMQLGTMAITDIEFIGSGNYKAMVELPDDEYNELFTDNICSMVAHYLDETGFNAEIESCEVISTIYQRGGLVKKYAQGGTIDTELENNLKILQDIKHGNYPFIDSNDPEIQEALKGIDTEPTDKEIKELVKKVEKAISDKVSRDEPSGTSKKEYWEMTFNEFKNSKIRSIKFKPIRWNKFTDKYYEEDYEISYNLNKDNETYTFHDSHSVYGISREQISSVHEKIIKQALLKNKPIPQEVLNDYPELQVSKDEPSGASQKQPWEMTFEELLFTIKITSTMQQKLKVGWIKTYYISKGDKDLCLKGTKRNHTYKFFRGKDISGCYSESEEGAKNILKKYHIQEIKKALSENKPVPQEVLNEYPELKSEQPSVETVKEPEEESVSEISPKQKIQQKIKGFEILLKLAKTDDAKTKIQQKIKGFNILLKLKK